MNNRYKSLLINVESKRNIHSLHADTEPPQIVAMQMVRTHNAQSCAVNCWSVDIHARRDAAHVKKIMIAIKFVSEKYFVAIYVEVNAIFLVDAHHASGSAKLYANTHDVPRSVATLVPLAWTPAIGIAITTNAIFLVELPVRDFHAT